MIKIYHTTSLQKKAGRAILIAKKTQGKKIGIKIQVS